MLSWYQLTLFVESVSVRNTRIISVPFRVAVVAERDEIIET